MSELPKQLYQHIAAHHIKQLEPAWLQIKSDSEVIMSVDGAWQHYFERQPVAGEQASVVCEALSGILPFDEDFELPHMQLAEGLYTDISALKGDGCDWLLFCDVSEKVAQLQQYQQASNELVLLQGELNRTLERYVGNHVAKRVAEGRLQVHLDGERRNISTLFVDIRNFTVFNEKYDAQCVMQTVNDYMDGMLSPVLSRDGMVDKITGDGLMAVFGVLDSEFSSIQSAFSAAQMMMEHIFALNTKRQHQGLEQLGIGVGIATGEAVLGMIGSHDRRCFTAIGRHVNLAARLESQALAGNILVDAATHQALQEQYDFTSLKLSLKGIGEEHVYAYHIPCIVA